MRRATPAIASNFALHEEVARRRADGQSILHLGFGEARFPIFSGLAEQLEVGLARTGYASVAGDITTRAQVAGYFSRRRIPTTPDQVVLAPGSKPLLFSIFEAIDGDIALPRPCWVTYPAQARLAGAGTLLIATPDECGGIPDPDRYRHALAVARREGRCIAALVLTVPDNPTGTVAPGGLIKEICRISEQHRVTVICDEIYRDMLHDPAAELCSPAELLDDRVVVTSGLSKSHCIGGWRIGTARVPGTPFGRVLRERILAQASEIWSSIAGPMEHVAAYAYSEPPALRDYILKCNRVHARVASALHQIFEDAGATCRRPAGGFYLYPDFEARRAELARHGCRGSDELQAYLLDSEGIAVLAGLHFGDRPSALRFRAATSLMYGDDDVERSQALEAADPVSVSHIRNGLLRVTEALARVAT